MGQARSRDARSCVEGALIRRTDVAARSVSGLSLMAIYHFSAKVISRATGASALAAAAYRSASRLHDERLGLHHDFTNKAGVIHSEVLLPDGAPSISPTASGCGMRSRLRRRVSTRSSRARSSSHCRASYPQTWG